MINIEYSFRHLGDRAVNLDRNGHFSTAFWSLSYMLDGFRDADPHFVSSLHVAIHQLAHHLPTKATMEQLCNLLQEAVEQGDLGEGSVSAAFYLEAGDQAKCLRAGDTRIYWLFRKERTKDHSRAQDFIGQGKSPPASLNKHPLRNCLTRALSQQQGFDILQEQNCRPMEPGEKLLMCSDGYWRHWHDEYIYTCQSVERLDESARRSINPANTERDNCCLMLLRCW